MKKLKKIIKSENGAAEMVEAAIIYPIVFLCIFFLIYVGLYLLQSMTVSAYAQKMAMLASREVAFPGYMSLVEGSRYNTAAVEADFDTDGAAKGANPFEGNIRINYDPGKVEARAYRYWSSHPLDDEEAGIMTSLLSELVRGNSIMGGGEVNVEITSKNVVITQYVDVSVKQKLMEFGVLTFFGIETPYVETSATASVGDTDELVRTTNFAVDAMETIAKKIGIDVDGIKEAVLKAKTTLGLGED